MEEIGTQTSGELLLQARRQARLSQTDVAERAHVAQSVISAYEGNRRAPSLATLSRLIEATGHHLVLDIAQDEDTRPGLPDTPLGRRTSVAACNPTGRHGTGESRLHLSPNRAAAQSPRT